MDSGKKGDVVFIEIVDQVDPNNNLINGNDISVNILVIFTIRLTKTQWAYTFQVTTPIFKGCLLSKIFLLYF